MNKKSSRHSAVRVSMGDSCHISQQTVFGKHVVVSHHVVIEGEVSLGSRVNIGSHVVIEGAVAIGDGVKVGAGAKLLGAKVGVGKVGTSPIVIGDSAMIGGAAVITAGVSVGVGAQVAAGSVVTGSVPDYAIVSGNPARIVGYAMTEDALDILRPAEPVGSHGMARSRVKGVTLHRLPCFKDLRGDISIGEFGKHVPFEAKRYFVVFGVSGEQVRGEHAHKRCKQFLVCVKGSCSVVADDGKVREEFLLDQPDKGLFLPPMIWGVQYKYSPDAVLLVLASEHYDPKDYIRDYQVFKQALKKQAQGKR